MAGSCANCFLVFVIFSLVSNRSIGQITRDTSATNAGGTDTATAGFITGVSSVYRYSPGSEMNCGVSKVSFQPGARTRWHSHAGGQIIVVTEGMGYYQERGKPRQIIRQGEAIICLPNVQHWHGATPDSAMTHVVTIPNLNRGGVTSYDHVPEEEYKSKL